MKKFKDFGINPSSEGFVGDKIKITKILNREITVYKYRITESKFKEKGSGKYLNMQIGIGDEKHVVFTGSIGLMGMIEKVAKADFPFITTIIKDNDRLEFT